MDLCRLVQALEDEEPNRTLHLAVPIEGQSETYS